MLLHLRPRLYSAYDRSPYRRYELADFEIKVLGLHLRGGIELATRRPYVNKQYSVGCRKKGSRKAVDGLLIETAQPLSEFECVARWAVEAEMVVTHRVTYRILDNDFDAVTDDTTRWFAHMNSWRSRVPACGCKKLYMEIAPDGDVRETDRIEDDYIVERRETFDLPTIERERILDDPHSNVPMPTYESTFRQTSELFPVWR